MEMLPPLQVTVDARGWSAILDVRLTLHRLGLLLATRLAEELRVFLVPTLWEVLDNTAYLDRHPERLTERGRRETGTEAGLALGQWERARLELGLSALRIFWAGDALHESSLPKDMDPGLSERFNQLAEGLGRRLGEALTERDSGWPLYEGSRDAAALAAAMIRYRPLILTLNERGEEMPPLCAVLAECGIPCRRLDDAESRPLRDHLGPILVRSAVPELLWDGLQLAMVHLVAPQALLLPASAEEGEGLFRGPGSGYDPWAKAAAYWYVLP
jgi:hypothetical protein